MNIVLFEETAEIFFLSREDDRTRHILSVLRRKPGDTFDAGVCGGAKGKATLLGWEGTKLKIAFCPLEPVRPPWPVTWLVGLTRPQTCRKILQEAATLGIRSVIFYPAEKGEPSYANSSLWTSGEWRQCLIAGASQGFHTRLPEVRRSVSLQANSPSSGETWIALDPYEAEGPLSLVLAARNSSTTTDFCLCFGPERGWSSAERRYLRDISVPLAHLGTSILRTESSCLAATAVLAASRGWM